MNLRLPFASVLLGLALPLTLTACGNKGPLVLPEKPAADTAAAQSAPVEAAPAASEADPPPPEVTDPPAVEDPAPPASGGRDG